MTRSYYSNTISDFLTDDSDKILGQLLRCHDFAAENLQRNAWIKQIEILKHELTPFENGQIYFEFSIPRMGKRVDNILIIDDFIFVVEFKVGDIEYKKYAIEQTVDYCLDLQNFHEGSHHEKIVPLLVSTEAPIFENNFEINQNLFEPLKGNKKNIAQIISEILLLSNEKKIIPTQWENSI